jgi:hypothetical protein
VPLLNASDNENWHHNIFLEDALSTKEHFKKKKKSYSGPLFKIFLKICSYVFTFHLRWFLSSTTADIWVSKLFVAGTPLYTVGLLTASLASIMFLIHHPFIYCNFIFLHIILFKSILGVELYQTNIIQFS